MPRYRPDSCPDAYIDEYRISPYDVPFFKIAKSISIHSKKTTL